MEDTVWGSIAGRDRERGLASPFLPPRARVCTYCEMCADRNMQGYDGADSVRPPRHDRCECNRPTVGQNIPQLAARMCAQCANGRRCVSVGGTESILTASVGVMADAHTPAIAPHAWTPSASRLTCTSDSFDQKQNNRLNYCRLPASSFHPAANFRTLAICERLRVRRRDLDACMSTSYPS